MKERSVASSLPLNNKEFTLSDSTELYHFNGKGYSLFFKLIKFSYYLLILGLLPLALTLMYIYNTGNDCQGHTSLLELNTQTSIIRTSRPANNKVNNKVNTLEPSIQEKFQFNWWNDEEEEKPKNFTADLTEIVDFFDPVDDLSHFFNKTISFLTQNYIKRYFKRICKLGYANQTEISAKYIKFCELYKKKKCDIDPDQPVCIKASIMWYQELNVVDICYRNWVKLISLSNRIEKADRNEPVDKLMPYFNITVFCCMLIFTFSFQYWHEVFTRRMNLDSSTIGEYSILLDKLPHGRDYRDYRIRENIESMMQNSGYFVKSINFAFDVREYSELKTKLNKLTEEKYKNKYKMSENEDLDKFAESQVLIEKEEEKIGEIRKKIEMWEQRFQNDEVEFMLGKAYLCFSRGEHRDHCYKKYKRSGFLWRNFGIAGKTDKKLLLDVFAKKKRIDVFLPEEPNDILWENLGFGKQERILRKTLGVFVGFCIITAGMVGLYYLKTEKVKNIFDFF